MRDVFQTPGAGQWERDVLHQQRPQTRYLDALSRPSLHSGLAAGFAQAGALVEGFDEREVGGYFYRRVRLVGVPRAPIWDDGGPRAYRASLPPRFVFKLLFKLHPGLRRRSKRAAEVFATRAWREVATRWYEQVRPAALAVNQRLQSVDVSTLEAPALSAHVDEVARALAEGFHTHLSHVPIATVAVGDFLVQARAWTGAPLARCVATLSGTSPASTAVLAHTRAVAEALVAAPGAEAIARDEARPAATRVAALRAACPRLGGALDAWLGVYGLRTFSGFDLDAPALIEMPEAVIGTVLAAIAGSEARGTTHGEDAATALRNAVPAGERERFDALLAEARLVYGMREDDVGLLVAWRLGLLRRALLEVGQRLVRSGQIAAAEHAFAATPDEVRELLLRGRGPTDLQQRHAARLATSSAPRTLGEPLPIPPEDWFPPACARVMRATMTYLEATDGHARVAAQSTPRDGWCVVGAGASSGSVVGRARVIRDQRDFTRIEAGDVLVADTTSPALGAILPLLGAIVTDRGGVLCHAAIVARELGMPAVVGTGNATTTIVDGTWVEVDGTRGEVRPAQAPTNIARRPVAELAPIAREPLVDVGPGRCVPLVQAGDVDVFGNKAAGLARALAAGLVVPDGVALDPAYVDAVAAGAPFEPALRWPVAVRSSAIGEDGAQASFAGQHLTVLEVASSEALRAAIVAVRESATAPGALAYRARLGIAGRPRMAIVIQEMVPAEVAGVMFTRADARVVEAVRGLGEALVSGEVTPERWDLTLDGAVQRHDRSALAAPCLEPSQLHALTALARRCEAIFAAPQDIEWAFVGERLHLLQSRPITSDRF